MQYKLAIFGNPVEHSISPKLHAGFARQLNLDVSYIKIKPQLDGFREAVFDFKKSGGFGANVTAPFKQAAFEICTETSERAKIGQSVNTLIFRDNAIFGDNTDGVGLLRDITKNIGFSLNKKRILIFGAGGAVRGILHPLLMEKPAEIVIANRTIENAKKLCDEFSIYGNLRYLGFDQLHNIGVDAVIDSTSFDSQLSLPESLSFNENSLFYDLKYNVKNSPLAKWAELKNCRVIVDGYGMVVEQALEAFFLWTGYRPIACSRDSI